MLRSLVRTVPPATEPVLLHEIKAQLRIESDQTDEDTMLAERIEAARVRAEHVTGRSLISQTWRLSLFEWPRESSIELDRPPLQSVTSVEYWDGSIWATMPTTDYEVDADDLMGRVVLAAGKHWPALGTSNGRRVRVTYVAGYGASPDDVPQTIREWILMSAATTHEHRETTVLGTVKIDLTFADRSLDPFRIVSVV